MSGDERGDWGKEKNQKHDTVAGLKDREIRIEEKAKQGEEERGGRE